MPTGAELGARATAREGTARVNLNGQLLGRIDEARAQLRQALEEDKISGGGITEKAPQVLQELRKLELEASRTATVFYMRALPGEDFDALKRQWPPTPHDWARYKAEAEAHAARAFPPEVEWEQFAPRLIGQSVYAIDGEPVDWTEQDGLDLWRTLGEGARGDLSNEAWLVNNRSALRPSLGIGTEETANTDPDLTTPPSTESRSPFF